MKYIILAIGCIFFTQNVNAQLTNAEVYDFEIGDVFQVKFQADVTGPYPLQIDTIIDKIYSPTLDTIFYTIDRLVYTAPWTIGGSGSYNESIVVQTVTNLNSPATHFSSSSCLPATDSSFVDTCGNSIERLHSNYDAMSCFEPETWYSDLYQGLGGPY